MATLDATAAPGWRTWAQIWPPELLLVLVLVAAAISVAPLNTDSGWLLVVARRLLDGDRLYVDIIEVNPPLIVWLLLPSAWVGRHLAIDDTIVVAVPVIGLEILCGLMALAALRRAPATPRTATTLAVGAFLIAFGLLSMGQVGQRDAMAGLLLLPYAALATRAASGLSAPWLLSTVAGVAGGLAVAIKPFFVAPWIAIEIAVAVSRRQFTSLVRVETVIVLLMQLAYATLVWLITPEWLTRIVPLARMTYGAYGASLGEVVWTRTSQSLLMCGFAGALSSLGVSTKRVHRLPEVLGAATLGFWAGYVIQSTEWFYQSIPVLLFGAASLAASVEHLVASLRGLRAARPLARAGIAVVALIVLISAKWIRPTALARTRGAITFMRTPYSPTQQSLADELSRRAVGELVYMFSTSLFPAFPAVNLAGASWPYHYGFLWPLPAFYPEKGPPGYRKPEAQSPVERRFFETVVSDLLKRPPRLIVVERGPFKQALGSRPFDFIEYFSGSPDFVELMRGYRSVGYVGSWELYERARY
jgi:hypothetical protein